MDTIGPIARSVEDAARILQVIAGFDPMDAITLNEPVPDYAQALHAPIANLRLGVPRGPAVVMPGNPAQDVFARLGLRE